jgi:hypothetical protein
MGAFLSPPHTDGWYLNIGLFPTQMDRISTLAMNAVKPSTALATLYKHSLLTGHQAQTLDLDRAPHITQTLDLDLDLDLDRASHTCHQHASSPS